MVRLVENTILTQIFVATDTTRHGFVKLYAYYSFILRFYISVSPSIPIYIPKIVSDFKVSDMI